jgi:hypothetical protein
MFVNNGPLDVNDVVTQLFVHVDGKLAQVASGALGTVGYIAAGGSKSLVKYIDIGFKPDDKTHTMTAEFIAVGGLASNGRCGELADDPNPANNTAAVTGTIWPALEAPVYPGDFLISAIVSPQTPGSIFVTTPITLPTTGQPIVPLASLISSVGAGSQPTITPLFGDGHGGFGPSTIITPGPGTPIHISLTQFIPKAAGDNHVDIGALNQSPGGVSIFPSDGGGGFNPPITTPIPGTPLAFVPLDLNGDKKLDLAVLLSGVNTSSPGSIALLQGDGTGHFTNITPQAPLIVGNSPSDIVTADFNGDGKADLAVANAGSGSISIFLGDGKGGFSPAGTFPAGATAGANPSALAVADLNGDGTPDLVVANQGEDTVTMLLGDGRGGFVQTSINIPAGPGPSALAIADFNGDGKLDVAVANGGSNTVTILLGDGSGAFVSETIFQAGASPSSLATADFDGDGKPDLAIGNKGDGSITILLSSSAPVARPVITQAAKSGKNLLITGSGFDGGATILVDGVGQRTIIDAQNPTTSLTGKKAGKHTSPGSVVQVQNSTGILSQWFIFK